MLRYHSAIWCLLLQFFVLLTASEEIPTSDEATSPTFQALQQDLRAGSQNLQAKKEQFWKDADEASNRLEAAVRRSQQRFKKRIMKNVFSQRVGWHRFRHSVRDHLGFAVGLVMVFRGHTNPKLSADDGGGAIALQTAQLGWHILNTLNALPHRPWLDDGSAVSISVASWKNLPSLSETVRHYLPPFFLALTLFQCWGVVLEEWNEKNERQAPFLSIFAAVALSFLGLKAGKIPIALAASSLSGAMLVYDSARAEIAGNWMYMLEHAMKVVTKLIRLVRKAMLPMLGKAMRPMGRSLLWLWTQKRRLDKLFAQYIPRQIQTKMKAVKTHCKTAWEKVASVWPDLKTYVQTNTVAISVYNGAQTLRRATKPILVPWGIAVWGVAVQLKYITNIGGVLKVFRLTLDPISFVLGQVNQFFKVKPRAQKAAIAAVRGVAAQLANARKQNPLC